MNHSALFKPMAAKTFTLYSVPEEIIDLTLYTESFTLVLFRKYLSYRVLFLSLITDGPIHAILMPFNASTFLYSL